MEKLERLTAYTEEVVTFEELKIVLNKPNPKAYIGFEPSGVVHLGWKVCTNKIKDFLTCGFDFTVLLADWHAYNNDNLGGDIENFEWGTVILRKTDFALHAPSLSWLARACQRRSSPTAVPVMAEGTSH